MIADRFDLDVYTSFYLTVQSSVGTIHSGNPVLNSLLPVSFRRKHLQNKLKKHYGELITRNSASIGYDLTYKIQESFRKFNYGLNHRLQELLDSIKEVIAHTIGQKNNAESLIEVEIEDLKEKLTTMALIQTGDKSL